MIINWLKQEFDTFFKQTDKILWFDTKGEYKELLGFLKDDFSLLEFNGSQLELKYKVESEPDKKWILYLPIEKDKLLYLKEYEFTSKIFNVSLYKFLEKKDVKFQGNKEEIKLINEMLPKLAVYSIDKGDDFWKSSNAKDYLETLIVDFTGTLLKILANPIPTLNELKNKGIVKFFQKLVVEDFGFDSNIEDVNAWIKKFTIHLALIETYVKTGKNNDFSFISKLPSDKYFDKCISFLETWMRDSLYKEFYKKLIKELEKDYQLGKWVSELKRSKKNTQAFLNVEKARWEKCYEGLNKLNTKADVFNFFKSYHGTLEERANSFWSKEGEIKGWALLGIATDIILKTSDAIDEIKNLSNENILINHYKDKWWEIDFLYRKFRADFGSLMEAYEIIVEWVNKFYFSFLHEVNTTFSELIENKNKWDFKGFKKQIDFWNCNIKTDNIKRGIFIIDAFRFEMAKELEQRLVDMYKTSINFLISEIPSVTAIGMSALMPHKEEKYIITPDTVTGFNIITENFSKNLTIKDNRKELIKNSYKDVVFFDLEEVVNKVISDKFKKTRLVVVFSSELDQVGTDTGNLSYGVFAPLLDNILKAIWKLIEAGFNEIHVVSDHGFLVLDELKEKDKAEIKHKDIIVKERYAIGQNIELKEYPKFKLRDNENYDIIFSRGLTCFKTPGKYDFIHGGVSLQEIIIPHLILTKESSLGKAGIKIMAPAEINNSIFSISLKTEFEGLPGLVQKRFVLVILEKNGKEIYRNNEPKEIEIEDVKATCSIINIKDLKYGDLITIKAVDAYTSEILDKVEVPYKIQYDDDL